MTISEILARADDPVWSLASYIKGYPLKWALWPASQGDGLFCLGVPVMCITQELLDAVEAHDAA